MGMDTEEIVARLKEFAQAHNEIVAIYLFGSRARGDAVAGSDVDVAILLHPSIPATFDDELRWSNMVMDALHTDAVDALLLDRLPPAFQFRITSEGRVVHSNDEMQRIDWEAGMLSRYYDVRPFHKIYDRSYLEWLKERFTDDQRREYERALETFARAN